MAARGAMGTLSVFAALLLCAQIGVTSALYTKGGDVEILTAAEFDEKVLQSDEYWVRPGPPPRSRRIEHTPLVTNRPPVLAAFSYK